MRSHRLRIPGRHAYHEHRARIGLPEHGRSILAGRVIRRHPFCVICQEPLRRRAHDLQNRLAVHRRGDLSSSERQRPALAWLRAQPESPCHIDPSTRRHGGNPYRPPGVDAVSTRSRRPHRASPCCATATSGGLPSASSWRRSPTRSRAGSSAAAVRRSPERTAFRKPVGRLVTGHHPVRVIRAECRTERVGLPSVILLWLSG
jgi:hypothetical protein